MAVAITWVATAVQTAIHECHIARAHRWRRDGRDSSRSCHLAGSRRHEGGRCGGDAERTIGALVCES